MFFHYQCYAIIHNYYWQQCCTLEHKMLHSLSSSEIVQTKYRADANILTVIPVTTIIAGVQNSYSELIY